PCGLIVSTPGEKFDILLKVPLVGRLEKKGSFRRPCGNVYPTDEDLSEKL
ncbi:Hypothetical protein CINCED_3A021204, partial [Cinara cedri]